MDAEVTAAIRSRTPFVRTLGIDVLEVDDQHALLRMPSAEPILNHVGGPHAGAIFTLGETAAAALLVHRYQSWLDRAVPLAVGATIRWSKVARSAVTAEARADGQDGAPVHVDAELTAGRRPEWETSIVFRREEDGEVCAEMTVVLTLRLIDR
jgi:uncharacterized protein (TIGR00369 family)